MNILEQIIIDKKKEVIAKRELFPQKLLEQSTFYHSTPVSLTQYIKRKDKAGVIAEFKRKSPSKGLINQYAKVEDITVGYMQAGASAVSVLTDPTYFGGKNSDLTTTRKLNYCPILRKDFVVSEYQIIEARSIGADAILLIATVLTKEEIQQFTSLAHSLGMEVLLEVHAKEELDKIGATNTLVGINNRDLKTFNVSLDRSVELANMLPESIVKIAESGISDENDMLKLQEHGFDGFLIGEAFMKSNDPVSACRTLIQSYQNLKKKQYAY